MNSKSTKPKLIFKTSLKEDIDNWYGACNSDFMGVDWKQRIKPELREKIVGIPKNDVETFLKTYLKKNYYENPKFLKAQKEIEAYWKTVETEVFKRIAEITKKPIWPDKILCYYTSFPRGHYRFSIKDNSAYMLLDPLNFYPSERFCRSIVHEILHFQFHKYFWDYMKKYDLSYNQINHIKEATTFLLNEEFIDLFKTPEKSYEIHWQLREELSEFWKKNKDFSKLLEFSAKLLKEEYPNLK